MKYSVILPTYNESESILNTVGAIVALNIPELEIVVVDDHSPDGTFEIARKAAAGFPCLRVLMHDGERGLSPSVLYGFDSSEAEFLCCMDADGQHRPEDLKGVLKALSNGTMDMMIGSRHVPGGGFVEKWNPFRKFFSWSARLAARIMLGVKIHDPMSGFFAIRRETYRKIRHCMSPKGFKVLLELAYLMILSGDDRIGEHPIQFALRKFGKSKLSPKIMRQYVSMLLELRLKKNQLAKDLKNHEN